MKNIKYAIILFIFILFFNGCEMFDKMLNYTQTKQSNQDKQSNKISFQSENAPKKIIISSDCKYNSVNYLYYQTQNDVNEHYYDDTKNLLSSPNKLKPFWDIRYVNSVTKYIDESSHYSYADMSQLTGLDARFGTKNMVIGTDFSQVDAYGSLVESKCINNILAAGTTINLNDAPEQYIEYAGPQSTFTYQFKNPPKPWSSSDGNLMIEAYFNNPIYINFGNNVGASVNFGVILKNKKYDKYINYVIGLYTSGEGWEREQKNIKFDPTTHMIHIGTIAKSNSKWITLSPKSNSITFLVSSKKAVAEKSRDIFYRVNISYDNLKNVLKEIDSNPPSEIDENNFGLNPEDWEVTSIYIQYEVEEEGGKALLSGSFERFRAYSSKLPL